jgi:hypothetical protein
MKLPQIMSSPRLTFSALAFRLGRCRFGAPVTLSGDHESGGIRPPAFGRHLGSRHASPVYAKPAYPVLVEGTDPVEVGSASGALAPISAQFHHSGNLSWLVAGTHVAAFRPVTAQVRASERRIRPISSTSGKRLARVYRQIPLASASS